MDFNRLSTSILILFAKFLYYNYYLKLCHPIPFTIIKIKGVEVIIMYQTIVIGGGPSGAMAAVAASEKINQFY